MWFISLVIYLDMKKFFVKPELGVEVVQPFLMLAVNLGYLVLVILLDLLYELLI